MLMGLLDSEAGKRRLLTVEIPVIERYNEGREPTFKVRLARMGLRSNHGSYFWRGHSAR